MKRFFFILALSVMIFPFNLQAAITVSKTPDSASKNSEINFKLEEILDNQKEILKQLAELKAEVLIVKARATR